MAKNVIANPPMGIYKGDIHIGQADYLILLDILTRYRQKNCNNEIICPFYSYNVFGKRGDKLVNSYLKDDEFLSELNNNVNSYIKRNRLRDRLNLSSQEQLIDNELLLTEGIQNDFLKLFKKGFLITKDNHFYLDCKKIAKDYNLKSYLDQMNFFPGRIEGELERLIDKSNNPIQITKSTRYAIANPLGGENIGPLFGLANLWNWKYGNVKFTMVGSNNVLTKYIFLRFLSQIVLNEHPGINEIFIWPKIIPENGIQGWDIKSLTKDQFDIDMLRYGIALSHSIKDQKVILEKKNLHGGRNFVYLIGNLKKILSPIPKEVGDFKDIYPYYKKNMEEFRFKYVLDTIEIELRDISKKINKLKDTNTFDRENKLNLAKKYVTLLEMVEPITPAIVKHVRS